MSLLLKQALNLSEAQSYIIKIFLFCLAYQAIIRFKKFMKIVKKFENLPGPKCGISPLGNVSLMLTSNSDLLTSK